MGVRCVDGGLTPYFGLCFYDLKTRTNDQTLMIEFIVFQLIVVFLALYKNLVLFEQCSFYTLLGQ